MQEESTLFSFRPLWIIRAIEYVNAITIHIPMPDGSENIVSIVRNRDLTVQHIAYSMGMEVIAHCFYRGEHIYFINKRNNEATR